MAATADGCSAPAEPAEQAVTAWSSGHLRRARTSAGRPVPVVPGAPPGCGAAAGSVAVAGTAESGRTPVGTWSQRAVGPAAPAVTAGGFMALAGPGEPAGPVGP